MIRRLFLVMFVALLAGCQTLGGNGGSANVSQMFDMTFLRQNLIEGKTTSQQVYELFGEPTYRADDVRGANYWSYNEYTLRQRSGTGNILSQALGAVGVPGAGMADTAMRGAERSRSLSINFDRGVVSSFEVSESR